MPTYYMDMVNGDDASDGSTFALGGLPTVGPWKTFTLGATAARIAPNDIIKIAKSPAPYSLGHADWTNLSKTVTLETAATATIENCENHANWTASGTGDTTLSTIAVATTAKQGSNCVRFILDSAVQTSIMQAYYDLYTHDTTVHDLSAYQKISFWIYNSAAIVANNWSITLCTDIAGATATHTFKIPAIPSTLRWVPLTLASEEGGNLSAVVKSIAVNTGSVAPTASSYIYLDNIIACTTSGLNLQSLISLNSAEQGGTEGWHGIQSIDGVTILLDNETNTKATGGEGYSGTGGHATTYARETIKTAMGSATSTVISDVMDSGTLAAGNIQYQGGYDTSSGDQTGETFLDGLNGRGYGIQLSGKSFITLNYLNMIRYNYGIYITSAANSNTITTITNANNNTSYGVYLASSYNNTITAITNANNNGAYGVGFDSCSNNLITTITNANNNSNYGLYISSAMSNIITTITNANNNTSAGIYFSGSSNNIIGTLSTTGNTTSGISTVRSWNYILNATIAETTKVSATAAAFDDGKVFINDISGFANIWTYGGNIVSQNATAGGTGIEWKMSVTHTNRASNFPLKLKLAEIACVADAEVTVTCYFKKSHATDIAAKLVFPADQLAGAAYDDHTCPSDTSRNQLTITFTPTEAGVAIVEAWAWWVANTADENVIIDDIAITQA